MQLDRIEAEALAVDAINIFCREILIPGGILEPKTWEDPILMRRKYEVASIVVGNSTESEEAIMAKAIEHFYHEVLVKERLIESALFTPTMLQKGISRVSRALLARVEIEALSVAAMGFADGQHGLDFVQSQIGEYCRSEGQLSLRIRLADASWCRLVIERVLGMVDRHAQSLDEVNVSSVARSDFGHSLARKLGPSFRTG